MRKVQPHVLQSVVTDEDELTNIVLAALEQARMDALGVTSITVTPCGAVVAWLGTSSYEISVRQINNQPYQLLKEHYGTTTPLREDEEGYIDPSPALNRRDDDALRRIG